MRKDKKVCRICGKEIETRKHVMTICITRRTDKPIERAKKKEGITIEWIRKVIEKRTCGELLKIKHSV